MYMQQIEVTLINKLGLHARAAAKLVNTASSFSSDISIQKGAQTANGKSIMAVMMLAASCGTDLVITAKGDDQGSALEALENLIADRFDEPE
ncbi:HPr family phosphocarrier protein [Litoribacillus peritrichatus]|uniref:HPr family phosphocarrier protein n=2 Tax=Litoribacillus peritrichatus TaxID=718191 RepID=A0ABP7N9I1_9GAMM